MLRVGKDIKGDCDYSCIRQINDEIEGIIEIWNSREKNNFWNYWDIYEEVYVTINTIKNKFVQTLVERII